MRQRFSLTHPDKYLTDLLVLALYFFFLDQTMAWQLAHPAMTCTLLMLLNILAIASGCFLFYSQLADTENFDTYRKSLRPAEQAMLGLAAFISVLGFLWWLVPFAALKEMGLTDTGFFIGMGVYFIVYMGIVANSAKKEKTDPPPYLPFLRWLNTLICGLFFFFSYTLLLAIQPQLFAMGLAVKLLLATGLFVFYLPVRFFLLIRPPVQTQDYILFFLSFSWMVYRLLAN